MDKVKKYFGGDKSDAQKVDDDIDPVDYASTTTSLRVTLMAAKRNSEDPVPGPAERFGNLQRERRKRSRRAKSMTAAVVDFRTLLLWKTRHQRRPRKPFI